VGDLHWRQRCASKAGRKEAHALATVATPPEQRIVLDNIMWDVYEQLLATNRDRSVPRFTYDRGRLEIISPSAQHEELRHMVALFVEVIAEEMNINVRGLGSITFRREDLQRGFEPDACFYVQNATRIRGKAELDLTIDPPPDVVIEVDLTNPWLAKFPIFAQLGVPEVWRYDGRQWQIFQLVGQEYVQQVQSIALPGLRAEVLTNMMDESRSLERLLWLRRVRTWIREQRTGEVPR
jgi:Uma2 family endonuclease